MNNTLVNLDWLENINDFDSELSKVYSLSDLIQIAKKNCDINQLEAISKKLDKLIDDNLNNEYLKRLNIGIIGTSTTNHLIKPIRSTGLRFNFLLNIIESNYNDLMNELDENYYSLEISNKFDFIFINIDIYFFSFIETLNDIHKSNTQIETAFSLLKNLVHIIKKKYGAQIIINNLVLPQNSIFGSYEHKLIGSVEWFVNQFNLKLINFSDDTILVFDTNRLACEIGLKNWHSPKYRNLAKFSFSPEFIPIYSDYLCRILASRFGLTKRCLIIDLDNTIWGGVIGDDGLEGIKIGNGDAISESFLDFQKTILNLRNRGIIVCVCSKNEKQNALKPFQNHPDMILREEHIAVFMANWNDKASNIREISRIIAINPQNMVFVDDNPAERFLVRRELPEISIPEMPEDPSLYSLYLLSAGYFESILFSEEDKKRADLYKNIETFEKNLNSTTNIKSYLKNLNMKISFLPFDEIGRQRITQLINKSNQFNLTTKRYNQLDIENFQNDKNILTFQVRLEDKFGDHGMISVIICKKKPNSLEIDTWLMSCRVLKRYVENIALEKIIESAKNLKLDKIIGIYIESAKNSIVKNHYKNLGFNLMKKKNSKLEEIWQFDINNSKIDSYKHLFEII